MSSEALVVIKEYCLLVFKACRLGYLDFEKKKISLLQVSLKLHILPENVLIIIYILLESISLEKM